MRDLQNILERIAHLERVRSSYALATVVDVEGSAYRRLGARMLIESLEQSEGTISGGCLESDVREQAVAALADGAPRLIYYDATSEDDIVLGTGLGCRGITRILIEPVGVDCSSTTVAFLRKNLFSYTDVVLATVFECEGLPKLAPGQCLAMTGGDFSRCDIGDASVRAWATAEAHRHRAACQEKRRSMAVALGYEGKSGRASVLIETLLPPPRVWVFGAGYDALPVVRLASEMGWCVSVVDHRPSYARSERFPEAHQVALVAPHQWPADLVVERSSAVVLMTHNFLQDQFILRQIAPLGLDYIGVLGPRQRTERLLQDLKGLSIDELFAPVGLDLGAETPEEIALSIVAEIQAARLKRDGGHLSLRSGPIHPR